MGYLIGRWLDRNGRYQIESPGGLHVRFGQLFDNGGLVILLTGSSDLGHNVGVALSELFHWQVFCPN